MRIRINPQYFFSFLVLSWLSTNGLLVSGNDRSEKYPNAHDEKGFIENKGQAVDEAGRAMDEVSYYFSSPAIDVLLTKNGLSYLLKEPVEETLGFEDSEDNLEQRWNRIDMVLEGANLVEEEIVAAHPIFSTKHYYLPHCRTGITSVKTYRRITYKNIYPKIDWVLYFTIDGKFKYDFVVHPGGDPKNIKFSYNGPASMRIDNYYTALVINTEVGGIREGELLCFQDNVASIASEYQKDEDNCFSFELSSYDPDKVLVIDPLLSLKWATYFGGNLHNGPNALASDISGNLYMCGYTSSVSFPVLQDGANSYYDGTYNAGQDAFISKFDSDRKLIWSTFYGGSGKDRARAVKCNPDNSLFVVGSTDSENFPTLDKGNGAYYRTDLLGMNDGFILEFDEQGFREWATLFGGENEQEEYISALDISDDGMVVVSGKTNTSGLPTNQVANPSYFQPANAGEQDAFVSVFNPMGQLQWSTYIGGQLRDEANALVSQNGLIYLCGETKSTDFPVFDKGGGALFQGQLSGVWGAFIMQFSLTGELLWSTYYGGTMAEMAKDVLLDQQGNLFVAGDAVSTDLPAQSVTTNCYLQENHAGASDLFILQLSQAGQLMWSTYFGGNSIDKDPSLSLTSTGHLFVSGRTVSEDIPTINANSNTLFQPQIGGAQDVFICQFNAEKELVWSTYFGGAGQDWATDINLIYDTCFFLTGEFNLGTEIVTVDRGVGAYYQETMSGLHEGFLVEFCGCTAPILEMEHQNPICEGDTLQILMSGGQHYLWDNGDTTNTIWVHPDTSRSYEVEVFYQHCSILDTAAIAVLPSPIFGIIGDTLICVGDTAKLIVLGDATCHWGTGAIGDSILVNPLLPTFYTVLAEDSMCSYKDSIHVNVLPRANIHILGDTVFCENELAVFTAFGADDIDWGGNVFGSQINISANADSTIYATSVNSVCTSADSISFEVHPNPTATFNTSSNWAYVGEEVLLANNSSSDVISYYWDFGDFNFSILENPIHLYASVGVFEISLVVTNEFNCKDSTKKNIEIAEEVHMYIPNAFTPNGDGKNDVFSIAGENLSAYHIELSIFDRWGQLVFQTEDPSMTWTGYTDSGNIAPGGIYIWKLVPKIDATPSIKPCNGMVTLIR